MSVLCPQKLGFYDLKVGMEVFICEGRYFTIVDKTIVKYVDQRRKTTTVQNEGNVETIFGMHGEMGWVVLEENPYVPGIMSFSHRAPIYNLFTFI
jgi:hypothetical protein